MFDSRFPLQKHVAVSTESPATSSANRGTGTLKHFCDFGNLAVDKFVRSCTCEPSESPERSWRETVAGQ